jgi:putative DNA primase/helicase
MEGCAPVVTGEDRMTENAKQAKSGKVRKPNLRSVDAESTEANRPLFPSPDAPMLVAHRIYEDFKTAAGLRTLLAWRGGWMSWTGTHWTEVDVAELRSRVYKILESANTVKKTSDGMESVPWNPNRYKVANVIEALAAVGHLPSQIDPPAWINGTAPNCSASQVISCRNGLFSLASRQMGKHTPALFNLVSVPFDYDTNVGEPTAWLEFLNTIWPDDPESIALLQEYFGYVLSGRMDMQKMLFLRGPIRSGKGTIAYMLGQLVGGRKNFAGPTLASLGTNFGLTPLLGKPLAIISDARLGNAPAHVVVERLLSITGEDTLTVDRKYRDHWTGKLPTRFVMLSNELPKFRDASTAIATRMLILDLTESFYGREDHGLRGKLLPELPAILKWSLEGLDRLTDNDAFTTPQSSVDAQVQMVDLASPVSAFVRECCDLGPALEVEVDALFDAWKVWAEDNGHHAGAKSTFGRDLKAVASKIRQGKPRDGDSRVRTYRGIALVDRTPKCIYCGESVAMGQRDAEGRPAHMGCQQTNLKW